MRLAAFDRHRAPWICRGRSAKGLRLAPDRQSLSVKCHSRAYFAKARLHHVLIEICVAGEDWNDRYRDASKGLDVIDGVQDAVRWLHDQIKFLEDRLGSDFNGESGVSDGT